MAAEVRKLARSYGPEAIATLVELMRDKDELGTVRKAAADSLLDRAYGKAVQQIEAGGPGAFDDMTDDELSAYIALKARKFIEGTTN